MEANVTRSLLHRRDYLLLTAALCGVIVYGSLVPLSYREVGWSEAWARFQNSFSVHEVDSRSDLVANTLLFAPFGFLLLAAFSVDRPWAHGFLMTPVVLAAGFVVGAAVEFVQVFFPPRHPDVNDLAAQSVGSIIGVIVWLCWGQRLTDLSRHMWGKYFQPTWAGAGFLACLAMLVVVHVWPLDLTISPADLYHKYKEGRIRVAPFTPDPLDRLGGGRYYGEDWIKITVHVVFVCVVFMPLGAVTAYLPALFGESDRAWRRFFFFGLAVAAFLEFLQVFVYSRDVVLLDVFAGGLAILCGRRAFLSDSKRRRYSL